MSLTAEELGGWTVVLLPACLASYFLYQGLVAKWRSRRLGNFALFCGLLALMFPESQLLSFDQHSGLFLVFGSLHLLLGVAGIALAVAALVQRHDGGVGKTRPLVGIGFGVLQLAIGLFVVRFFLLSANFPPWTYHSPDGIYSISFPSAQWRQAPLSRTKERVVFVRTVPFMQAHILKVIQHQSEADFKQVAEASQALLNRHNQTKEKISRREGTNSAGNHYCYWTMTGSDSKGDPVFVADSLVWNPTKQTIVEVFFEGPLTMLSAMGKATYKETFEKSAEMICLSVE